MNSFQYTCWDVGKGFLQRGGGGEEARTAWSWPHLPPLARLSPTFLKHHGYLSPTHLGGKSPSGLFFVPSEKSQVPTMAIDAPGPCLPRPTSPPPTPPQLTFLTSTAGKCGIPWTRPEPLVNLELGSVASSTAGTRSRSRNQRGEAFFLPHRGPQLQGWGEESTKHYSLKDRKKWAQLCQGREGQPGITE